MLIKDKWLSIALIEMKIGEARAYCNEKQDTTADRYLKLMLLLVFIKKMLLHIKNPLLVEWVFYIINQSKIKKKYVFIKQFAFR